MRDEAEYKGDSGAVDVGARRCREAEGVTDLWSERAQAYRESEAHRRGRDLDLIVEWAAGARTALDVATGGGHVARRLREAGLKVVTTDAAPGMEPDVVCRSEELPFADGSFDVVVCRVAVHHFDDPALALREMVRVSGGLVLISDNLHGGEKLEQAEKLRDPSHVRNYTEQEWHAFLTDRRRYGRARRDDPASDRAGAMAHPRRLLGRGRRARSRARRRPGRGNQGRARSDCDQGGEVVAIVVDRDTKLVVQGLTGREGTFHGLRNRAYGTQLVAGVTPGKGGQDVEGVPVFDTVAEAVAETGANTTMIFVPARFATDADLRGGRRRHRHGDLHRRGTGRARHAPALQLHPAARRDHARPELPRCAVPRQGERRDHPRGDLQRRARSASSPARARSRTRSATS